MYSRIVAPYSIAVFPVFRWCFTHSIIYLIHIPSHTSEQRCLDHLAWAHQLGRFVVESKYFFYVRTHLCNRAVPLHKTNRSQPAIKVNPLLSIQSLIALFLSPPTTEFHPIASSIKIRITKMIISRFAPLFQSPATSISILRCSLLHKAHGMHFLRACSAVAQIATQSWWPRAQGKRTKAECSVAWTNNIGRMVGSVENASTEYYNIHGCQDAGNATFIHTFFL